MNKSSIIVLTLLILFFSFVLNIKAQPTITNFSPASGPSGIIVNINGTNFNPVAADNIVFFGATKATVNSATSTNLSVTVPLGATNQFISIIDSTTGLSANSISPFITTFPYCNANFSFAPKVNFTTDFSPYGNVVADFDDDGTPDFAVVNRNSNTLSIFRNTSTSGAVSFATKVNFTTGLQPYGVAAGDLNGDGKPDIVITNYNSNTVSVFKNISSSGNISFSPKIDFVTGVGPYEVVVGDLDLDGKPDLGVTNKNANTISVLKNTSTVGNISFAFKVDFITGPQPWGLSICDIDGDAKSDLAVANSDNCGSSCNTVSVFPNISSAGTISFATKIDYTVPNSPAGVKINDIDGDGKSDIVVTNSGSNLLSIFRSTSASGAISFAPKIDILAGTNPIYITTGDLNGDSKLDIVVGINSNKIALFKNTSTVGTISFAPKVDYSMGTGLNIPVYPNIADMDGDGVSDLTVVNKSSNTFSVLCNLGGAPPTMTSQNSATVFSGYPLKILLTSSFASTYTWEATNNLNTTGESIINQISDTLNDIIINNSVSDQIIDYSITPTSETGGCIGTTQTLSVTVKLAPPAFFPSSGPVGTIVIITGANFDSIPSNNIVFFGAAQAVVSSSNSTQLTVIVPIGATYQNICITNISTNSTACSLKPFIVTFPCSGDIDTTSLGDRIDFPTGSEPYGMATSDLDGDGKSDVVVVNSESFENSISVYKNTSTIGTVSFSTPIIYGAGGDPRYVSIGDIDGDGKPDIVESNSLNLVSVFRNTSTVGTISFAPRVSFTAGQNVRGVVICDFNADGKQDLAAINPDPNTVSILNNTSTIGNISFEPKVDYPTGPLPWNIVSGDLNGDARPDLVITNYESTGNTISILQNTSMGNISFAPKIDIVSGQSPESLAIGDLDLDGKLDLAVGNYIDATISVFRNTSENEIVSFAPPLNIFMTQFEPHWLAMIDFDGDGKLELLSSNGHINIGQPATFSIFKNTSSIGAISLAPKVDFARGIFHFVAGDMDGDEKPDITATDGATYGHFMVIRNLVSIPKPIAAGVTLCTVDTAVLTASGASFGQDYKWYDSISNGNLLQVNGSSFITPTISTSTTYYVSKYDSITLCESSQRTPVIITVITQTTIPAITQNGAVLSSNSTIGNQWFLDNIAINNATGQDYMFSQNGIYTVVVNNGCSSDTSAPYVIMTVGINDTAQAHLLLDISPNPFTSQTSITFSQPQISIVIKIIDLFGKELKILNCAGNRCILQKEEMPSGIYLLQITDGHGNIYNRKVIIQ